MNSGARRGASRRRATVTPLSLRAGVAVSTMLLATTAAKAEEVTLDRSARWYIAAEATQLTDSAVNPGNRILQLPRWTLLSELRPDVRVSVADLTLVARPRFGVDTSVVHTQGLEQSSRTAFYGYLNEVFATLRVNDWLQITYGIQNYEWGPALTLNPSNAIVQRPLIQNFLTLIPGRPMGRVNLSIGRNFSGVLLVETRPSHATDQAYERPKALAKFEYSNPEQANYVGFVVGAAEHDYSWIGEYANLQLREFSLYADARHTLGSDNWYPTSDPRAGFVQSESDSKRVYTLAVVGWRWSMPRLVDLRLEFLHNGAGYSETQETQALATMAAQRYSPVSVDHYFNGVPDMRGRHYAFAVLRMPDIGPQDHFTIMLRYLLSMTDQSSAVYFDGQWDATDFLELHLSLTQNIGPVPRQFTDTVRRSATVGARLSW